MIVTTPQDVSIADVSRGIQMFTQLRLPVLGVVENMSGFICPHCGERTDVFGTGGGRELAERNGLRFLGEIPLDPRVRVGGGDGQPLMAADPGVADGPGLPRGRRADRRRGQQGELRGVRRPPDAERAADPGPGLTIRRAARAAPAGRPARYFSSSSSSSSRCVALTGGPPWGGLCSSLYSRSGGAAARRPVEP